MSNVLDTKTNIRFATYSTHNISSLFGNLKDLLDKEDNSNTIYKILCSECEKVRMCLGIPVVFMLLEESTCHETPSKLLGRLWFVASLLEFVNSYFTNEIYHSVACNCFKYKHPSVQGKYFYYILVSSINYN